MATFKEALRRVYSDFVDRRSRVRVVEAAEPSLACDPIFVMGMYRSGTTLLRYIVDSHSKIACPPESEFISHLDAMLDDERSVAGFGSLGFDEEHVVTRMRGFAAYFFEAYAASRGRERWADKSPRYVNHLDFVHRLFPTAKMLMIYRHPLDQVFSALKKNTVPADQLAPFERDGEEPEMTNSRYWSAKASDQLAFSEREPSSCYRIIYEEMCDRPVEILKPAFEFLGEAWEDNVLSFYEADHDRGFEDGRAGATRGFSVSKGTYKVWSEDLQRRCWEVVEPVATSLGYTL